jgi:hypothetical protein
MAFKKAVKTEAKLRMAIAGPSGSGKTFSALKIATAMGGSIAVIDTEHGSASKYADLFNFDVLDLDPPYHPDRFIDALNEAQAAGYKFVIIDSLSHAWNGPGGVLEIKEKFAQQREYNDYTAWGPAGKIQQRLIEAIVSSNLHVIACMRSKTTYEVEKNDKGKSVPVKLGMQPIQRDGTEYEFDVALDMDIHNNAVVGKTRCVALTGEVFYQPGQDIADILTAWLTGEPQPDRRTPDELRKEAGTKIKNRLAEIGVNVEAKDFRISTALADLDVEWANEIGAAITAQDWAKALTVDMSETPIVKITVPNGTTIEELFEKLAETAIVS